MERGHSSTSYATASHLNALGHEFLEFQIQAGIGINIGFDLEFQGFIFSSKEEI